jgi:hypothetical protein
MRETPMCSSNRNPMRDGGFRGSWHTGLGCETWL